MAADRQGLPNLPRHWASCRPGDPSRAVAHPLASPGLADGQGFSRKADPRDHHHGAMTTKAAYSPRRGTGPWLISSHTKLSI